MVEAKRRSGAFAVLTFFLSTTFFAVLSLRAHYALPSPQSDLINNTTGLPQLSETNILRNTRHLSEGIGYRIPGTLEHALGEEWLLQELATLKAHCDKLASVADRSIECEMQRQQGSGTHRFDMMDRRVYKNYVDLSNVVFRISNGSEASKQHAILLNGHLDSTLPSPGAADDALPCMIMLDSIRVLLDSPDWTPQYAVIFLWNNAEESLQDGSHLFSTQHEWAPTSRAVINLEAAGVSGPELLFQATSEEMIEAYSKVPWPYGTVLANDVFSSGIILSDTDFRQFQEYGNLTGLDMAIVGDSYVYHTRKDIVQNIEPGHMAENVLALIKYLASSESPLPRMKDYSPPRTTYFSLLGKYFIMWSFGTASIMYNTFLVLSILLLLALPPKVPATTHLVSLFGIVASLIASALTTNAVAFIMKGLLGRGLSWFARAWYPLVLYGPAALFGLLLVQYMLRNLVPQPSQSVVEYSTFSMLHLFWLGLASLGQSFGIGSAAVGFLWGLSTFGALALQYLLTRGAGTSHTLQAWIYGIAQVVPAVYGFELGFSLLDVFVPLTGRMGEEAPAEHIVATIVSIVVFLSVPSSLSLAHQLSKKHLRRVLQAIFLLTISVAAIFASGIIPTFDELHPRRLFVLHSENIFTGDRSLHFAVADSAPEFHALAEEMRANFGESGAPLNSVVMNDRNADWDILYPFSQFLTPYDLKLPSPEPTYTSEWTGFVLQTTNDVWHRSNNTRTLTITIDHPGLIWTVMAFDAHVLAWSLDNNPLTHYARHHIKEASFYGVDRWSVDLAINATTPGEKPLLTVDFQGIQERGMWPAKRSQGGDLPAMKLFAVMDSWLEERFASSYDTLMLGIAGGVITL
ncbi:hypothetical protein DL93DRAFT_2166855 [Clavulina sp. PMI_390]|nr:hypothetical protein DL93DRAFT_2166855 [Clavulina sp. PMI_390]